MNRGGGGGDLIVGLTERGRDKLVRVKGELFSEVTCFY